MAFQQRPAGEAQQDLGRLGAWLDRNRETGRWSRNAWGWRIDGPRLGPMVLVDSLLGRVTLPDSVVGVIRGAAAQ